MNRSSLKPTVALLAAAALSLSLLQADDWPQWRGPHRNGISQETGLLQEWPENGPKLVWAVKDVGAGFSTPAVVGQRIYLMGNEGVDKEFVEALNAVDGQHVWTATLGKVGPNHGPQYPGARSTPTVDGEWLYALGSDGDLACLGTDKGTIRWHKNLRTDFAGQSGNWAYAESPLVDGDTLICTPGGTEATLVALNKHTGELIWKSAVPGGDQAAYASVQKAEIGGVPQYIQYLQKGVVGLEAKTGKFLWRYDRTAQRSAANIPTPVIHGDLVYSAAGQSGGGLARVKKDAGAFAAEEVYFSPKLPKDIGGAIQLGNYLYGTMGAALACVEFETGKIQWEERSIAPGSLCYADKRLYLHGENGEVALIEATPSAYHEKGRFTPPDPPDRGTAKAWSYPVVAQGRLYIRDGTTLWSFDIRRAGTGS